MTLEDLDWLVYPDGAHPARTAWLGDFCYGFIDQYTNGSYAINTYPVGLNGWDMDLGSGRHWKDLDALTAQAVLYELGMPRGSDEPSRST